MKVARAGGVVAVVLLLVAGGRTLAAGDQPGSPSPVLGPGQATVELPIHYSQFLATGPIRVKVGTTVRFVVDNDDPINHELIVGDAGVHARHEAGTEPFHEPRPGEVTVRALSSAETTFEFTEPGAWVYACHLPGHYDYGMHGVVEVVA